MRRTLLATGALLWGFTADAEDVGLKPGLWEVRVVKQVIDGRDRSAQVVGMADKMQQALANLPPEKRARVEATMRQHGDAGSAMRVCISAAMAKEDAPVIDKDGTCRRSSQKRSGSRLTYEFRCESKGTVSTGNGEATIRSDFVASGTDRTMPVSYTHLTLPTIYSV